MGRRHADVDDRHIRLVQGDHPQQLIDVRGLPDDLDAGIGQQRRQSRADQHDVVGDYHPHGNTAVTVIVGAIRRHRDPVASGRPPPER